MKIKNIVMTGVILSLCLAAYAQDTTAEGGYRCPHCGEMIEWQRPTGPQTDHNMEQNRRQGGGGDFQGWQGGPAAGQQGRQGYRPNRPPYQDRYQNRRYHGPWADRMEDCYDRREDFRDRREDRWDRREDIKDRKDDQAKADRLNYLKEQYKNAATREDKAELKKEIKKLKAEIKKDKKEDKLDKKEDKFDRKEDRRDRREGVRDRCEDRGDGNQFAGNRTRRGPQCMPRMQQNRFQGNNFGPQGGFCRRPPRQYANRQGFQNGPQGGPGFGINNRCNNGNRGNRGNNGVRDHGRGMGRGKGQGYLHRNY